MAVFSTAFVAGVLGVAESSFIASVSAFALNAAVGIGVSLLSQQLLKQDMQEVNGVQGKLQAGGDLPRSVILGKRCTAGSLVYANTWGKAGKTPNAYFTQVIALSDLPIAGVTAVWVNGAPVTVDTGNTSYHEGYPVVEYKSGRNDHLWIKFFDGTQTVADPFLYGTVSSSDRPYSDLRVGRGVAYAVVTSLVNDELFSGFPTFRFEVQGTKLYDVSRDSSAGGNGPHRWNNPATWGGDGDDLPAVQIYNILRGITYEGVWLYGLQSLTAARLPAADWIAQINKCRAGIAGPMGMEATYLTSAEVQVASEISKSIDQFLLGCHGRLIEAGGIYKLRAGEPGISVFAFSDDDIITTQPQTDKPFLSIADSINGVTATYPEPNEAWNTKAAPPLYNAAFELRDGKRRLLTDLQLDVVYRSSQAQRIQKSALSEARRERRHTVTLPPGASLLEPGDVVTWTSNSRGYPAKLFRVDGIGDRPDLDATLDITEVDPSDYAWDQQHDYTPPVFAPIGPIMPPVQVMKGWTAEPAAVKDAGGIERRPAIKISCDVELEDVRNVWVQVRLASTGAVVFDSDSNPYAEPYSWLLSGQWTIPDTEFQARGRYVPYSNRATDWSEWLTVKTPDIRIQAEDVLDGAITRDKIANAAINADKIMNEAITSLKLADQAVSTAKLQVAAVTADVLASNAVIASKLADGAVTARALAQGAVDATALASGLKAVEVVNALPATGNSEGRQVFLTTDGKLYRYHNGAWTAAVAAGDVNGTLNSSQIADNAITGNKLAALAVDASKLADGSVSAAKVADGAITNSKLANLAIDAAKLADSTITATKIADGAISTPKLQANAITADKIAANVITAKHLVLTDMSNMADNGWQNGSLDGWQKFGLVTFQSGTNEGEASGWFARSNGPYGQFYSKWIAVTPGETYFFSAWTMNNNPANSAQIFMFCYDANGNDVSKNQWAAGTELKGQWVFLQGQATVPAGTVYACMCLYTNQPTATTGPGIAWSKPVMRRASGAELIVDGAITATKVAANAITADKIAASSITAKHLVLADTSNMADNGWQSGNMDGWEIYGLYAYAYSAGEGDAAGWYARSTSAYTQFASRIIAATPGEQYYLEVWAQNNTATSASLWMYGYDANNVNIYNAWIGATAVKNAWVKLKGQATVPAGVVKIRMGLYSQEGAAIAAPGIAWSKPVMRRASSAELIVDGAITANKIAAQAITADKMAANSVTAGTIAAGAVSASQIAAGAITADKLAAGSVSAEKLAVGSGKNLLVNSDWSAGTTNWDFEWSNDPGSFSWGMRYDGYAPQGGTIEIYQRNGTQGIEFGIGAVKADGAPRYANVIGGRWYEFSGLYYGHRCNSVIAFVRERYEWPTAFVIDGIGFWRSVSISALPASA